jgi:acetyl esterase/lipase
MYNNSGKIIQKYTPLIILYILSWIRRELVKIYLKFFNFHYKKLFKNIYQISYQKIKSKNIVVVNGGGLVVNDMADLKLSYLLLKKIDYNIINIDYPLLPDTYEDALKSVIKSLYLVINRIEIDVFISDSMGSSLLLHAFKYVGQYFNNKKMILISPLVNFDLKPNINIDKDFLDYSLTKKVLKKYNNKNEIDYYNLPKSLVIAYTDEMFYFDIINFYKKLNNSKIIIGKNCKHADIIHYALSSPNKKSVHNITNEIIKFILN